MNPDDKVIDYIKNTAEFVRTQEGLVSVFVSTTYSMSRLYSENGYPNDQPSSYRYGQYLVTNVFWNVTPNMQVGAEYLRGWRTDFNNSTHHANRMNLLVQYSF